MTTTTETTKKKTTTLIAPPETTTGTAKAKRTSTRETKDWYMILDESTAEITLQGFDNVTELHKYLSDAPGREIVGDFKVRGWAKPFNKSTKVSFS